MRRSPSGSDIRIDVSHVRARQLHQRGGDRRLTYGLVTAVLISRPWLGHTGQLADAERMNNNLTLHGGLAKLDFASFFL